MSKDKNTPVEEVKKTKEKPVEPVEQVEPVEPIDEPKEVEEKEAQTIEELLGEKEEVKEDTNSVPLKTFLELKRENKEFKKELEAIKKKEDDGASKSDVSTSLRELADKYDVDKDFLSELTKTIYSTTRLELEEELEEKLKPIQENERIKQIDKIFGEHFDKIIKTLPEYKNVNKEVIKQLSLLPNNSKKTIKQLIEETYGEPAQHKENMEDYRPSGNKDVKLDMSKIDDPEYFESVMDNPTLKKQYNEKLINRIDL